MRTVITADLFEAYLYCPTKCHLRMHGELGKDNLYSDWIRTQEDIYRIEGIKLYTKGHDVCQCVDRPHCSTDNMTNTHGKYFANIAIRAKYLESNIHLLEHFTLAGRGYPVHFIPVRFFFNNKLSKYDKLLITYDAIVLSEMLRCDVSFGKIVHGDKHKSVKVKTTALENEVRKHLRQISLLMSNNSSPDLILNKHCAECEYQSGCRHKAMEKDDLSLLTSMSHKERKKLNSKGIFTVTQLSYTFRPRRRPKRLRDKKEKYHHSLRALAIRENKIYTIGDPSIKIDGTPVYMDVEGIPDREFYYLIGARIRNNDESVVQNSLWANSESEEKKIWHEFLELLSNIERPVLVHFGSFETLFIKRMYKRYGNPFSGAALERALDEPYNLISSIYAQVYFPVYSSGLKEISGYLGFEWSEIDCSGLLSTVQRHLWEYSTALSIKEKLIRYNIQDCEALELLTNTIFQIGDSYKTKSIDQSISIDTSIIHADADNIKERSKWKLFKSSVPSLEYINSAAHWNYQRDRVYARSGQVKKKAKKKNKQIRSYSCIDKIVRMERSRICPGCNRTYYIKGPERTKTLLDILFGHRSLKLRFVKYVFHVHICRKCGMQYGIPDKYRLSRIYGWNLIAYFFYQVIDLRIPQRTVVQSFNRLFGLEFSRSTLHNLKMRIAEYYTPTKQLILERIIRGNVIHADETRANIKGKTAFVWVLTSYKDVFYFLSDNREGENIKMLFANFKGVLVSDFYTAYDSINCPQQKCLIHLMRDLNDEVLNYPFDEQLKQIVVLFGDLLKSIVETVDRYGLKKHFLRKHLSHVDTFYRHLEIVDYQSEAAVKCKERFERNRDTLFTFLKYDGIPWNNNNAEHAVKSFARLRDVIAGTSTEKGTDEYLTLLSICQTCKYSGLDYLDFLRSGEKDIDIYATSSPKKYT